jgi:hypothetical protein
MNIMNIMNVMNIMNMWKSEKFMPYPTETKVRMNVMNVVPAYFASWRTLIAKHLSRLPCLPLKLET